MDDLNIAVEKTPASAQTYFHYAWADECSDGGRGLLRNWRSAKILGRISAGRRFRVCYAKRLSKRIRTVIV